MKVIAIDSYSDTPSLRETAPPKELAPDQLLVRVRAAGMNPVDVAISRGFMQSMWPAKFPLTLGSDFAGLVERVGPAVTAYRVGDAVYGKLTDKVLEQGSYGEYVVISEKGCVSRMPKNASFAEAAGLPTAAMTALVCVDIANITRDSRVLVNGATGGVGSYAVQLAADRGAHVIATARGDTAQYVQSRGATTVIDYTREKLLEAVKKQFPDGIDALIDLVSDKAALEELCAIVRKGGVMVSTIHAADENALAARGLIGKNVMFQPSAELVARVTTLVEEGKLTSADVQSYPLERAPDALEQLRSGHVHGKLVLATA